MTGLYQCYIDMEASKARRDNAPEKAIYYNDSSREWKTADDIASPETKARLEAFADRLREHERPIDAMNGKRGTAWIGRPPLSIILMQRLNATRI